MKKCVFIVPYFGKFPDMFPIFLKTCGFNRDFEWIFFTDIQEKYDYPDNVKVIYVKFEDLKKIIRNKFNFEIIINEPHKLCDYKPAYGYIFEEYLKDYAFWGHCDIDTIMGNLSKFITDELLEKYDKLFCLGHMILYRNTYDNNRVFMSEYKGKSLYKESFTSPITTIFDETYGGSENINTIFLAEGLPVLQEDWSANFQIEYSDFVRVTYNAESELYDTEERKDAFFVWNNGSIYRYWIEDNQLISQEFMYMHFQLRQMKFNSKVLNYEKFKIIPEIFEELEVWPITLGNFKSIRKKTFTLHFLHIKKINLKAKLKRWKVRIENNK